MTKTLLVLLLGGVLRVGPAAAQEPPLPTPVSPPPSPPTSQVPETPAQDPEPLPRVQPPPDPSSRRDAILMMEGLLASAVRIGAERTAREIQAVQPGLVMFRTSVARARGVYLEGYGVFFHVEIPTVRPSVVNMIETIGRERLAEQRSRTLTTASAAADPTGSLSVLMDPDAAYVRAVKTALIGTMVDYSKSLGLRPDEWLTIAARGDGEPLVTGEIVETKTMILRVRGADLADFLAGRLSDEEVRKRVEMREF